MSKRNNDNLMETYMKRGFQPRSVVNFLALLGWGSSQREKTGHEILSMDDLVRMFSLESINRAPAVMNEAKLVWLNKYYFKEKLKEENTLEQLACQLKTEISSVHGLAADVDVVQLDHLKKILVLLQDRIPFIPRVAQEASYFWIAPILNKELFTTTAGNCLNTLRKDLECSSFTCVEGLQSLLEKTALKLDVPYKQFMAVTRLAITGLEATPSLAALMNVIGERAVRDRLNHAINIVSQ